MTSLARFPGVLLVASVFPISWNCFAAAPTCPPRVEWSREFVGTNKAEILSLQQTADGSYVIGADTFRLMKVSANGVTWACTYGTSGDKLQAFQQTTDGGFILAGYSSSAPSATRTAPSYGAEDFWIVRLDANGNKLWDQSYGGSASDFLSSVQQTADGGFILGGFSYSPASGNKFAANLGSGDFWVVRVDANGQKLWDRTYGADGFDALFNLQQTADGGFIFAGQSYSNVNGNDFGDSDGLLVRVDGNGSTIWSKRMGDTNTSVFFSARQTTDGGFIAGGTFGLPPYNITDGWVVRLDGAGNVLWEKLYGGSHLDGIRTVRQMSDGGYIVGAASQSPADGNKTSPSVGGTDFWIFRLDATGNKIWDGSYGSTDFDYIADIRVTDDGGFFLGGSSLCPVPESSSSCLNVPTTVISMATGCPTKTIFAWTHQRARSSMRRVAASNNWRLAPARGKTMAPTCRPSRK